jgi:hypothetical protein
MLNIWSRLIINPTHSNHSAPPPTDPKPCKAGRGTKSEVERQRNGWTRDPSMFAKWDNIDMFFCLFWKISVSEFFEKIMRDPKLENSELLLIVKKTKNWWFLTRQKKTLISSCRFEGRFLPSRQALLAFAWSVGRVKRSACVCRRVGFDADAWASMQTRGLRCRRVGWSADAWASMQTRGLRCRRVGWSEIASPGVCVGLLAELSDLVHWGWSEVASRFAGHFLPSRQALLAFPPLDWINSEVGIPIDEESTYQGTIWARGNSHKLVDRYGLGGVGCSKLSWRLRGGVLTGCRGAGGDMGIPISLFGSNVGLEFQPYFLEPL